VASTSARGEAKPGSPTSHVQSLAGTAVQEKNLSPLLTRIADPLVDDYALGMNESEKPRSMAMLATTLLLLYWCALFTGTHLPNYSSGPARYNDKTAHYVGYAGLAFLLSFAWTSRRRWNRQGMLVVLAATSTYAMVDELSQIPIPGRSGEFGDWIADFLGSISGILAFTLLLMALRMLRGRPMSSGRDSGP
jgi:VanZ family protein